MNKYKINLSVPLLFIWPFGAFLMTFNNLKSKWYSFIYTLFCTLLGFSFSFKDTSADSYRVAMVFDILNVGSITSVLQKYFNGHLPDLYKNLFFSITKSFTDNPKVLFSLFGFVFGLFSYKSLKLFFGIKGLEKSFSVFILGIVFISLNSVININGARFWTASIICFCCIINLIIYDKKIWMLGLFSLFLFHFSFLFIIPFLFIIYVLKSKLLSEKKTPRWIFILYISTFVFALFLSTNIINLSALSSLLPSSISRKVELYNSSDVASIYEERGKTLFHIVSKTFGYAARIYLFFVILKIKKELQNSSTQEPQLQKLFNFVLLFFSLTFLLSLFPSGGRFVIIATQVFFFFFIRFYIKYKSNTLQRLILGLLPVYSFLILFNIVFLALNLTSSVLWYGNIFWIIYEGIGFTFVHLE